MESHWHTIVLRHVEAAAPGCIAHTLFRGIDSSVFGGSVGYECREIIFITFDAGVEYQAPGDFKTSSTTD